MALMVYFHQLSLCFGGLAARSFSNQAEVVSRDDFVYEF